VKQYPVNHDEDEVQLPVSEEEVSDHIGHKPARRVSTMHTILSYSEIIYSVPLISLKHLMRSQLKMFSMAKRQMPPTGPERYVFHHVALVFIFTHFGVLKSAKTS
jgi:hypothetical protein